MTISVSKELQESLRKRFLLHLEVRVLLQRRLLIPPVRQARRETAVPEATTTGENTLGCLIDGWVYTSGRYGIPSARFYDDEENHYVAIDAEVGIFSGLHLVIVNPRQGAGCTYIDAVFDREDLEDGEAYITRMDGTIISGTFSGGSIKEGRFDIKYREKPEGGEAVY